MKYPRSEAQAAYLIETEPRAARLGGIPAPRPLHSSP
jgi:hypothetical protein